MVRIDCNLIPHGTDENKRLMAAIVIANDGTGTTALGNYTYEITHSGKYLEEATKKGTPEALIYRKGQLKAFDRKKSIYHMLAAILVKEGFK